MRGVSAFSGLLLWLSSSAPADAMAGRVEVAVILEVVGRPANSARSFVVTVSSGQDVRQFPLAVAAGARHSDRSPLGGIDEGAKLMAVAQGYWSPEVEWRGVDGEDIRLRVFPTGLVSGSLLPVTRTTLPSSLWAEFEGTPATVVDRIPRGRVECPMEHLRWSCNLPAGTVDLRLGQAGYVPSYYWEVRVDTAKQVSLTPLRLARGSSVVGFVYEYDGERPAAGCRVELGTRQGGDILTGPVGHGRDPTLLGATTNHRGFFQVIAPAAGEYQLSVVAGERGFATLPIELVRHRELRIPVALVLQQPSVIELNLRPPLDTKGRTWRVDVMDMGRVPARDALSMSADRSGHAVVRVPGKQFAVLVLDGDGQQWASSMVDSPPSHQVIDIELPFRWVRGSITLADRAIQAQLTFVSKNGAGVKLEAGADGAFEGTVPASPSFDIVVYAEEPSIRRHLLSVSVPDSGEIVLTLPDTRLWGRVVDERGRTQASSIVTVRGMEDGGSESSVQVRANDAGAFEVRGLPPGLVVASAETPTNRQSDMYTAQLQEGDAARLELVAREKVTVRGQLVSERAGEPVPGALIKAISTSAIVSQAGIERTTQSDADGRFELRLAAGTREVDVTVMAFGHALRLTRVAVEPQRGVVLQVPAVGGTLTVELDPAWDLADRTAPLIALVQGPARESLAYLLRRWGIPNGVRPENGATSRVVLPSIAPGEYSVCVTSMSSLRQMRFGSERCARGSVPAGGEATVTLSLSR